MSWSDTTSPDDDGNFRLLIGSYEKATLQHWRRLGRYRTGMAPAYPPRVHSSEERRRGASWLTRCTVSDLPDLGSWLLLC